MRREEKQKMRIAIMGHKHVLSREGGIELVVKELATGMAARGHEVTCLDRSTPHVCGEDIDGTNEYQGVRIKRVFTINRRGFAAMTSSFFAALHCAFGRYDVAHVHAEGPAAMCWIPKLFGKKVICTIHGLDWKRKKWNGFASKYIKWGEKQAVKHADKIIVLSRDLQKYFSSTYNRDTVFIPNGTRRGAVREADEIRNRWGLEKDNYVLFLGRIVPEKGLSYLIDAWKDIQTDKKLVIAGGSSDTSSFMKSLQERAGDNVIFTGFQQGKILEELYSNAYIYTLPSDLEGMPLSLLEAMSYGNCCVVSDIPECTEIVEDKALVFERGNTKALRNTLQHLIVHPEIVNSYKKTAADYICQKYNWNSVVEKTLDNFTNIRWGLFHKQKAAKTQMAEELAS